MIADGRIDVDFMVTHRFGLEETQQALELVTGYNDGVIKAVIKI
jgi:threonine dehydrogenase-like Zn-dependent dehydrogenase